MKNYRCLTDIETLGLNSKFGLADGHAYQDLTNEQHCIVSDLTELWRQSSTLLQKEIECLFHDNFYRLAKQPSAVGSKYFRICTSASQSIDMVGALLFRKNLSVGLIHPTFDNLAQIMRRWDLKVTPLTEDQVFKLNPMDTSTNLPNLDAIFIVNPNNPTGSFLMPEQAANIISWCKNNNKLLIVDQTFRFFNQHPFDLIKMLKESGISYISIEDTGKTFPTQDMKASIISYSADMATQIEVVYEEIFLAVSPFALLVLNHFVSDALQRGIENVVLDKVRHHRRLLLTSLEGTLLTPASKSDLDLSVQWLKIEDPELFDLDIVEHLSHSGLYVLPGRHFFWADSKQGERYVRVSLLKPHDKFAIACQVLRKQLLELGSLT